MKMMGHREPLKSGDEWDYLTRARRFFGSYRGKLKKIKRGFNKRIRKAARLEGIKDARMAFGNFN